MEKRWTFKASFTFIVENTLLVVWIISLLVCTPSEGTFELSECYGQVIGLSCRVGEKIKVIEDFFGYSSRDGNDACSHKTGDCVVPNNRDTSVVHRYCEGQQTCTRFQVDRRQCGTNLTNYEQIEYDCIPESSITDICTPVSYTSKDGYISSPNFPSRYPTDLDCTCTITANTRHTRVQLHSTFFSVKYDSPCKDYLEIDMSGEKRRLCGAFRDTILSREFKLYFHTDDAESHVGFWMHFSIYPSNANATLSVKCNTHHPTTKPELKESVITTTKQQRDTTTSTFATKEIFAEVSMETKKKQMTKSTPILERDQTPLTDTTLDPTVRYNKRTKDKVLEKRTESTTKKTSSWKDLWSDEPKKKYGTRHELSPSVTVTQSTKVYAAGDAGLANGPPEDEFVQEGKTRLTGIIIISICVGGIILLIVILTLLMCISRRRRPRRDVEKERKRRLEQRLNSLSFYDSIPLYESLRSGGVVSTPKSGIYNMGLEKDGLISGSKRNTGDGDTSSNVGSDVDSAIYAELERQSRKSEIVASPRSTGSGPGRASRCGGPAGSASASPRSQKSGKGSKGKKAGEQILKVNLKGDGHESDIYTHV